MTIRSAINSIDELMHNTYTQENKVTWLSRVDTMVKKLVIDTHDGGEDVSFSGYNEDTDLETVLLIPEPFDEAYLRWMEAQIHYHNGEYDKYNNAVVMFNTAFDAYKSDYTRNHMPLQSEKRFLF